MSVVSKNPFALLDGTFSSHSSSNLPNQHLHTDDSSAPAPAVQKEAPAPVAPQPARGVPKSRGGPAARGGKYYARGGKPQAAPAGEEPVAAADGQRKFEGAREGGRGRGRGGRGGAGGDRGDRGARGGRGRPFDRHSQTGKTDSDKKIHQSWGGDDGNTEFKTEQAATVDAAVEGGSEWPTDGAPAAADWAGNADAPADAWAAPAADPAAPAAEGNKPEGRPRREREPEEEDNTLTLEQYQAQQKEKDSAVPKLEATRQANEGADGDLWKGAVALAKNEEEDAYFVGKSKAAPKARAKKDEKVYLEIEARFERPNRDSRPNRGGDRGGDRGRGGARGGRPGPAVNVDDQTAFPSLS
ncbi:hypothetical protein B0H34DRAFT_43580 [Crassisporium funariophilum]|nr:hypothetical protein B0H34DRAFT_43580 [Crassisporium funariophilum]